MKKLFAMMLTGALLAGTLTACGSNTESASGTTDEKQQEENVAGAEENADADNAADNEAADNDAATGNFDNTSVISVISREDGSGTRGAFIELFGIEQKDENGEKIDHTTVDAVINNSTEVMLTSVAGDLYSIGYVSLGSLNDTVKAVKIDGADATVENIKSGDYTIQRPFNIATKDGLSEVAQDFINYIMSADGQAVIEDKGYISVAEGEAFTSNNAEGKIVVAGSSSVTPVMEKLKEAYVAINTNADIEIQESDSTTGMTAAMDGTCDIGMASRDLKDSEIEGGLKNTVIALDGIAVIVNKENPASDLTKDDVMNIYTGEITSWDGVIK